MYRLCSGSFVVALRPDLAPATVLNFLTLARRGYYDGMAFHRVVPGFVAQTGDPTRTGFGGPGYTIRCEVTEAPYARGSVGMALAGPDTGGSQLFIAVAAQPHLDRRYTIFGRVTTRLEVVESLQQWDRIVSIRIAGDPETPPRSPHSLPARAHRLLMSRCQRSTPTDRSPLGGERPDRGPSMVRSVCAAFRHPILLPFGAGPRPRL